MTAFYSHRVQELKRGDSRLKAWPVLGIAFIQFILLLAHWFIYQTWIAFCGQPGLAAGLALRAALLLLGCSFVVAALLSFYLSSVVVTAIYKVAAFWLGFLNYLFLGACLTWLGWWALELCRLDGDPARQRPLLGWFFLGLAVAVGVYGLLNARRVRIRRISIYLPTRPPSWRGRTALVISDLHLGHVNGLRFSRRIAALAASLHPDVVFLPGDFFDGSVVAPDPLAAPFKQLSPPFGMYFSTGNHDEFGDAPRFFAALASAGIRVLNNEKVIADGLQIVGVPNHDTTFPMRLRATLEALKLDRASASILLNHVPNRLPIVEEAGISLQLSGHTHGGQLFPFTWFTRRVFGKFTHGLHSFGALQVLTSYGAGTWGPPMRVGTSPEMVLLTFE
jgi:hypothetical protein